MARRAGIYLGSTIAVAVGSGLNEALRQLYCRPWKTPVFLAFTILAVAYPIGGIVEGHGGD